MRIPAIPFCLPAPSRLANARLTAICILFAAWPASIDAQSREAHGVLDYSLEEFFRLSKPVSVAFPEPFLVVPSISFSPALEESDRIEPATTSFSVQESTLYPGFPLLRHRMNQALSAAVGPTGPSPNGPSVQTVLDHAFILVDGKPTYAYVYDRSYDGGNLLLRLARCQSADGLGAWETETIAHGGEQWARQASQGWSLEDLPEGTQQSFSKLNLLSIGNRLAASYVDTVTFPAFPEESRTETFLRVLVREPTEAGIEWKPIISISSEAFRNYFPGHTVAGWPPPVGIVDGKIALAFAFKGDGVNGGDALYLALLGPVSEPPGPMPEPFLIRIASRSDHIRAASIGLADGQAAIAFYGLSFAGQDDQAATATFQLARATDGNSAGPWRISELGSIGLVFDSDPQALISEEAGRTVVAYRYLTFMKSACSSPNTESFCRAIRSLTPGNDSKIESSANGPPLADDLRSSKNRVEPWGCSVPPPSSSGWFASRKSIGELPAIRKSKLRERQDLFELHSPEFQHRSTNFFAVPRSLHGSCSRPFKLPGTALSHFYASRTPLGNFSNLELKERKRAPR